MHGRQHERYADGCPSGRAVRGRCLLRWGVGGATVFGLLLAGLAWAAVDHWLAVIGPMLLCMVAFAFIFPQSIAGALQPFLHIAGSARRW